MAYYREGRLDQAERLFQELFAERRGDPRLAMALGMLRAERGDAAGAIEPLKIAVRARPADYASWLTLAEAYRRTGGYEQAEVCYLKVLELNPREIQASRGLLQAYQQQGKGREAEHLVRTLQQRAGDSGDPRAP
jgi:predicted Zn-dependent protease